VANGGSVTRAALVAIALLLLPPSCAKMLGQKPPPEPTAEPPEPKPLPVTSATTPPVFTADPGPPPSTSTSAMPPSTDLAKARAAADAKDWKKVKGILEKKARAGKASADEAQLAFDACTATKDKSCVDAVKAKYPMLSP
jgi:hypothetical protein